MDNDDDTGLVNEAPVTLVITADYNKTMEKYGERGVRYVNLEAGCAAQNIFLQASALRFGSKFIFNFEEGGIQSFLGSESPLIVLPLGVMKEWISHNIEGPGNQLFYESIILLPEPNLILDQSLEGSIALRRSIREYGEENLTVDQVSDLRTHQWSTAQIMMCVHKISPDLGRFFVSACDHLDLDTTKFAKPTFDIDRFNQWGSLLSSNRWCRLIGHIQ